MSPALWAVTVPSSFKEVPYVLWYLGLQWNYVWRGLYLWNVWQGLSSNVTSQVFYSRLNERDCLSHLICLIAQFLTLEPLRPLH